MDSSTLMTTAARRNPLALSWGGPRLTNPVVHDPRTARHQPAATAAETDPGRTHYTPGPRRGDGPPLHGPERDHGRRHGPSDSAIASYQAVSQSISFERSDSFEFSVRTAEGDTATISMSSAHSETASVAAGRYANASGRGSMLEINSSSAKSLSLEISVAGDLNDAETASINALLQKVQGVADDFFAGNQAKAAREAQSVDISDGDKTLGSFSFQLQSQESLRAVATYASVAGIAASDVNTAPALPLDQASAPAGAEAGAEAADTGAAPPPRYADFLQQLLSVLENNARNAEGLAGAAQSVSNQPVVTATGNAPAALPDPAQAQATAQGVANSVLR